MVVHPAVIAILTGSVLTSLMLLYAVYFGIIILKKWDLKSGSELQLSLERRTYLISTILTYAFGFQLLSFFLFIYITDQIHPLFIGAMCAAGTLNVNVWGYPAIVLKLANCVLAGLWLVVNGTDNRAYDYPLIRKKYALLLFITPFIVAETVVQGLYFTGLDPDIITSCCGSLFSSEKERIVAGLRCLAPRPAAAAFFTAMGLNFAVGLSTLFRRRGAWLFSLVSAATFLVSIEAIVSFIAPYIYELPTHHCPFCILQGEYGHIGYVLYGSLFGGVISGASAGLLSLFRRYKSLSSVVPTLQRKLVILTLVCYGVFLALTVSSMVSSRFTLIY